MTKKKVKKMLVPGAYLFIPPPPDGYVSEIAAELGCSVSTVQRALRLDTFSRKAEEVRRLYAQKFIKPYEV